MDNQEAGSSKESVPQDALEELVSVAQALGAIANSEESDSAAMKAQIAAMVAKLNAATKSIVAERQQMRRIISQQSICDADSYQNERRRIEPRKPAHDPQRVDWKPGVGF